VIDRPSSDLDPQHRGAERDSVHVIPAIRGRETGLRLIIGYKLAKAGAELVLAAVLTAVELTIVALFFDGALTCAEG